MDEEKVLAAERATATEQDRQEREVSSRWRTDTVIRQRDRQPVVPREMPAEHDYFDLTDDEAATPSSPTTGSAHRTRGAAAPPSTPPMRGRGAYGRGVSRPARSSSSRNSADSNSSSNMTRLILRMEERRLAAEAGSAKLNY